MKTRIFGSIAMAFAIAFISACTKKEQFDPNYKVMNIPILEDTKSLDPAVAYDTISMDVMPLSMESLLQYKYTKTPLELEPLLAEAMPTVSADKKTYTFKIKKGVLFQDDPAFPNGKGRELKANDFVYGWKRLVLPEVQSPGTFIFDEKVVGWDAFRKKVQENTDKSKIDALLEEPIEGFKVVDDYTIEIKLAKPYPQLLYVLAMGFGAPVAKEVAQKYGQNNLHDMHMVGTGPYRIKEFTKGSKITLVKNPTFRGEIYPSEGDEAAKAAGLMEAAGQKMPFNDEINFLVIKEDQPRWLNFLSGNTDSGLVPKDSFDTAIENGNLKPDYVKNGIGLQKVEEAAIFYFNFNMKDKIVGGNNAMLRKAFSLAINRDEYIRKFRNGRAVKAVSIVPRVIAGHTGKKELVNDYNPEKAKEYLAKAGYPGGKGLPVIKYDLRGADATTRQQAEFIKTQLEEVGIKLEVIPNTFPAYLEKEKNGNLQFFLGGWNADFPDAENFLFLLSKKSFPPGPNASNYSNPAFEALYDKIAFMFPSPERNELIKKAEEIAYNDGVWAPMFYTVTFWLNHSWLKNYRPDAQIANYHKYFDVDMKKKQEMKPKLSLK